jgi:hypothetical protein
MNSSGSVRYVSVGVGKLVNVVVNVCLLVRSCMHVDAGCGGVPVAVCICECMCICICICMCMYVCWYEVGMDVCMQICMCMYVCVYL